MTIPYMTHSCPFQCSSITHINITFYIKSIVGTAAGSLVLPFLIKLLVETYAFNGTLLILGGCMLHISISAAVYRPLAVHVLISKQNRNIVKLQEATSDALKEQQINVNKESLEHQNHFRKMQSHFHNHHHLHHQVYDPDDIVAKLQVIIRSGKVET